MRRSAIKVAAVLACVLLLSACGIREGLWIDSAVDSDLPYAQGTKLANAGKDDPVPPDMQVTVGGITFTAMRGSYCWNSEGHGVCADTSSLGELIRKQREKPAAAAGDPVLLHFDPEPVELRVTAWQPGNKQPEQPVELGDDRSFKLAGESGRQLYVIDGNWPEGSSSYVFWVNVGQTAENVAAEEQPAATDNAAA